MGRKKLTEKQEETLQRMKEVRQKDTIFLRDIIASKLKWAIAEKAKGVEVIEKQLQQIKENKEIIIKLDAIITLLTDLVKAEPVKSITPESPKE